MSLQNIIKNSNNLYWSKHCLVYPIAAAQHLLKVSSTNYEDNFKFKQELFLQNGLFKRGLRPGRRGRGQQIGSEISGGGGGWVGWKDAKLLPQKINQIFTP